VVSDGSQVGVRGSALGIGKVLWDGFGPEAPGP
jgi:hypothetical protein